MTTIDASGFREIPENRGAEPGKEYGLCEALTVESPHTSDDSIRQIGDGDIASDRRRRHSLRLQLLKADLLPEPWASFFIGCVESADPGHNAPRPSFAQHAV